MRKKPIQPEKAVKRLEVILIVIAVMLFLLLIRRCNVGRQTSTQESVQNTETSKGSELEKTMDIQLDSLVKTEYGDSAKVFMKGEVERMEIQTLEKTKLSQQKQKLELKSNMSLPEDKKQKEKDKKDLKELEKLENQYNVSSHKEAYYRRIGIELQDGTEVMCIQRTDLDRKGTFLFMRSTTQKENN